MHRPVSLLLGLTLACGAPGPEEATLTTAGPLERGAYAKLLAEAAGGPVSVDRVVELAAAAADRIEREMDRLAASQGEPAGWRPLFERLSSEAPADEEEVLAAYRAELRRAAQHAASRDLVSLPETEPEVVVLENLVLRDYFSLAVYHRGRFAVTTGSGAAGEAGYLANHCWVCIPPLAVHEGYPGHHVAFARMEAAGRAPLTAELARHKPFIEGWGLYAEMLMLEEGYYEEAPRRLGAWRMILLRLARAEIDARLHGGGLKPKAAEEIYRRRLLLTPAAAATEVRTHLAKPTVKASYVVGLLQILELREAVRRSEPELSPRGFHDRLLGPPAAVPRIARERFAVELGPTGEADLSWPWSPGRPAVSGLGEAHHLATERPHAAGYAGLPSVG